MSLYDRLSALITELGSDYKQFRVWITGSSSGDLTGLATSDKTSLIAAINEARSNAYEALARANAAVFTVNNLMPDINGNVTIDGITAPTAGWGQTPWGTGGWGQ